MPVRMPTYRIFKDNGRVGDKVETVYSEISPSGYHPLSEYLSHKPNNHVTLILYVESDPDLNVLTGHTAMRMSELILANNLHTVVMTSRDPSVFPPEMEVGPRGDDRALFLTDLAFLIRGKYVLTIRAPRSPTKYVDLDA